MQVRHSAFCIIHCTGYPVALYAPATLCFLHRVPCTAGHVALYALYACSTLSQLCFLQYTLHRVPCSIICTCNTLLFARGTLLCFMQLRHIHNSVKMEKLLLADRLRAHRIICRCDTVFGIIQLCTGYQGTGYYTQATRETVHRLKWRSLQSLDDALPR